MNDEQFEKHWPTIDAQSWPTEPKEFARMVWKAALATTTPDVQKLVEAAKVASKVMREAESLVSASMHDAWHADNQPHGAYHDLRFKRIRLDEAIAPFMSGREER